MMDLTRELLLTKIQGFLSGTITKDAIYNWALEAAVSDAYEDLKNKDLLVTQTVQLLIGINKDDKNPADFKRKLQYHQACLMGDEEYVPKKIESVIENKESPADFFTIIRIYVIVFAASSLFINLFSLINPKFLQFGEGAADFLAALKDAAPFLIHAAVMILPLKMTARGLLFFPAFLVMGFGMLLYWYIPIQLVNKFSLSPVFILILLPFSAMPATLAVLQLVVMQEKYKK